MHEVLYAGQGRIAYKGQLFSAPMDWRNMLEQIEASDLLATSREKQDLLAQELRVMAEAEKFVLCASRWCRSGAARSRRYCGGLGGSE